MGATRIRVLGIGPRQFFEWRDGNVPVANELFKDTYASPLMRDVIEQVEVAKSANRGPFFFGPKLSSRMRLLGSHPLDTCRSIGSQEHRSLAETSRR